MAVRKLTPHEHEQRIRAAHAKSLMLQRGLSIREAAVQAHVSGEAIRRWFPTSVVKDERGQWVAHPDRAKFRMRYVARRHGLVEDNVRGSGQRSLVGEQHAAIARLLDPLYGDERPLLALRGRRVAGIELETDPAVIEQLYEDGRLEWLIVYADADDE